MCISFSLNTLKYAFPKSKIPMWPCPVYTSYAVTISNMTRFPSHSCCCSFAKCIQLFVTPWIAACQVSLSPTISHSLVRFMATESVMPSNHLILCRPLLLCFQSFPASGSFPVSQLFASGGQSMGAWALVLPMSVELISFRIDRFELLAIQETQESSASQFESMNSSALNLPSSTTLPSVHDYWKIHSFDHMDLCWQSDVSAF